MNASTNLVCPLCGGLEFKTVGKLIDSHVLRCRICWLEVTDPFVKANYDGCDQSTSHSSTITSPEYIEAMMSQFSALYDLIQRRAANRLQLYSELLGRKPENILEVGSGTGWMVHAFNRLGVQSVGLESDALLVSQAQKIGADVRKADICQLNPNDYSKFDVICSSQTLEHILDPKSAIINMKSLGRPGCVIHVDVPNSACWGARIRRLRHGSKRWGMLELPHHQIGYYPVSLHILFTNAGLEILRIMEKPTNDAVFGQTILPDAVLSKIAMYLTKYLGHGYLLVGIARKPS